ncbi:PIR Superfamily Protein [Plasmodium malariae]|uniref:PIR Superfamily Protein n=1 Tax=Plasmodium malariae TaxID=5858 RepID=A0A1A8X7Q6_PLAMA|nr:PIR Superfamily Protein [Plasmodium malariae]
MVELEESKKNQIFAIFEEDNDDSDSSCSVSHSDYCTLLNKWLNTKKNEYISEGPNCESNKNLLEEKFDVLWVPLKNGVHANFSCDRITTPYDCSVLPELKTDLSVCFTVMGTTLITCFILYKISPLGQRVHYCLNEKKRIIQNVLPEASHKLLESFSENETLHSGDRRITIGYNSVEN